MQCETRTIIDHFITDDVITRNTLTWCQSADYDHCYAIMNLKMQRAETNNIDTREIINYHKVVAEFTSRLNEIETMNDFSSILEECIDASKRVILVKKVKETRLPWMTNEINNLMKSRDYMC